MLHLHHFSCVVDTGVSGQSCSGCSLYLRLDNRYCNAVCEELGARREVGLAFAAGQSYGLASQASRNPQCNSRHEDIQVSNPEGAPHPRSLQPRAIFEGVWTGSFPHL